jgi:hypothetical protein
MRFGFHLGQLCGIEHLRKIKVRNFGFQSVELSLFVIVV